MNPDLGVAFHQNHRRLFLRGHTVLMHIGAHDFEKQAPQRVVIHVDLWVPLAASTPTHDDLTEVVDYDFVRRIIATLCGQGPIQLQETLCDAIVNALLAHPHIVATRVSTEKPDVYPDCEAVGVEVFRIKPLA
jgi:dihydroneopterin aldolase